MPTSDEDYVYDDASGEWLPASAVKAAASPSDTVEVRDAVGNLLADGDQVTLIKDGFETKTDMVTVSAPWYQWPVIEFFADNFSPARVTDRRIFNFNLQPRQMIPDEELRSRARQLRSEAQLGQ
jgi:hypothetical protein